MLLQRHANGYVISSRWFSKWRDFESASDYDNVTISSGATLELSGNITVGGDWSNSELY